MTASALRRARRARLGLGRSASRCARSSSARSLQEFLRGARVRQRATGTDSSPRSSVSSRASRRRYGGYIVHVGIVLMFLGFAGTASSAKSRCRSSRASRSTVGPFTVPHDALQRHRRRAEADGHGARDRCSSGGKPIGQMTPARWFFAQARERADDRSRDPPRRSAKTCTSCSPATTSRRRRDAHVIVNPLVNWIWIGFGVMAFGTIIALLPERRVRRSRRRTCPTGAVDHVAAAPRAARRRRARPRAAHRARADGRVVPKTPLEKDLQKRDHLHVRHLRPQTRRRVHVRRGRGDARRSSRLVSTAKTREEIYQFFIAEYGSQERSPRRSTEASIASRGSCRISRG